MPVKLSTTRNKIDLIDNTENRFLVQQYHTFMIKFNFALLFIVFD